MKRFLTVVLVAASLFAYSQTKDHPDGDIKGTVTDQNGGLYQNRTDPSHLFALLLFCVIIPVCAESLRRDWEMKMDTLQFSGTSEEYLFDKDTYHCLSCVPKADVKTDGTDEKVAGRGLRHACGANIG